MSEQIREQVSAFLDGELPNSEAELLLKRLTRDAELRESFGRYALIGETLRGAADLRVSKGFAARVNQLIDGAPGAAASPVHGLRVERPRWWRPFAGAAVAAGVAAVAVFALQQRAVTPEATSVAQNVETARPKEAISYTVPVPTAEAPGALPAARLTNYVFAHSKYSSVLGQDNVLSGLLTDADEPGAGGPGAGSPNPAAKDSRVAP